MCACEYLAIANRFFGVFLDFVGYCNFVQGLSSPSILSQLKHPEAIMISGEMVAVSETSES